MKLKGFYLLLTLLFLGCSSQSILSSKMTYEDKLLYYPLKHVLSKEELKTLLTMDLSKRDEWLKQSWKSKDPTPATEKNEFKEEFDRRVKYALDNFGTYLGNRLWDDRGDVYVIYGEPEEREMGIYKAWRQDYKTITESGIPPAGGDRGNPWEPDIDIKKGKGAKEGDEITAGTGGQVRKEDPIASRSGYDDFNITYGEIWHFYTQQLTLQFEDQKSTGFCTLVPYTDAFGKTESVQEFSMRKVSNVDNKKLVYQYDYQGKPFDFALDVLPFRGEKTIYNLDVNLGLPLKDMGLGGSDSSQVQIMRRISILDKKLNTLYSDSTILTKKVDKTKIQDQLIIDQITYKLTPGEYTLAVEMRDMNTQKVGIYRKKIIIPEYSMPGTQEISPLVMASLVRPAYRGETKFVKHGYVVVPAPSRVYYPEQLIYFYYEVYNLKKDNRGKT
ncbi:MAG: GWxTD domain-containing protein, partial [candidate division Zixibacteria bacterium]|nr:GWxTD domain-containing protein [candidate division Zixibacteria bacterium]